MPRIVHYRPFGWAATWCGRTPLKAPALVCAADPKPVDCRDCLGLMRRAAGEGELHADAVRELTAITLDIATKKDLADLREQFETITRELIAATSARPALPRYLDVKGAAAYLKRSEKSIRSMVDSQKIPVAKVGGKLTFDREALDRWFQRKSRRAFA